jgi:Flp pilus assembly protein TadD
MTIHDKGDKKQTDEIIGALANAVAKSPVRDAEIAKLQNGDSPMKNAGQTQALLARVYIAAGDPDSAIAAYNEATTQSPKDQAIAREYGLWLESIGQGEAAKAPLSRAYALNDKDADVIAALQRLGVVVGPSLKYENEIAKPLIPKGPIPEVFPSR